MSISREEAAAELLRRRMARKGLLAFTRYTFPGYRPAPHHHLIAETLDAVARGEKKRVMIFMPPRHGKSELASKRFPAFFLGANPKKNIIAASYNSDLAADFGREVRGIVDSSEFQALFNVSLSSDSKAANRWHTNERGMYVAAGVGGSLTGRGSHCFVAGTLVQTNKGLIPIENLEFAPTSCKAISYNQDEGKLEFRRIQAFSARKGFGIYRITSASGRVVEATADHPFYSRGRYIEAHQLAPGDPIVLLLQDGFRSASFSASEKREQRACGFLLREGMLGGASRDKKSQSLQGLRQADWQERTALLRSMPTKGNGASKSISKSFSRLRNVQLHIQRWREKAGDLLFQVLCKSSACQTHVRAGQPSMEAWGDSCSGTASFRQSIPHNAPANIGQGWSFLRRLLGDRKAPCPPYRRVASEQCSVQSRDALPQMPSPMAWGEGFEAVEDTVALVERVCEEAVVYDIQVEKNANFFANGFLVHNCLLIDDPIKNREEADSELMREKVWRWYTSTAYTRLESDIDAAEIQADDWLWRQFERDVAEGKAEPFEGAIVLVQTRWSEDDLGGRLLKQQEEGGEQWEVLELPAIRKTEDGEEKALWPAKYPISRLKSIRDVIGPRDWSALYQQAPAPDEGLYFKQEWIKPYDKLPVNLRYYGASDYAVTADGGDWTVHGIFGVDPDDNIYVVHIWRAQTESNLWIEALCDLILKHKPLIWAEEQGQILKSLGPFIDRRMREKKAYCARQQFTSASDKPTRARSFQARMAMGKVYLPSNAPWLADFVAELLSFPAGVNDDQVDVCSLLGRLLDVMVGASRPKEPEKPMDAWRRRAQEREMAESSDWKVA